MDSHKFQRISTDLNINFYGLSAIAMDLNRFSRISWISGLEVRGPVPPDWIPYILSFGALKAWMPG